MFAKSKPKPPVKKNLTANIKSGGEYWTIILAEVKALDQRITNPKPMITDFSSIVP